MRFKLTNLFFVFLLLSVSFSPVLAAEPADVAPSTPASALERAPLSKGWSFPPVPILNPMDTDDTPDRQTVIPPSDDDAAVPQVSLHLDPLFSRINDTHNFGFSDTLRELEPAQSPSESISGFDSVRVRATDTGQLVSTTGIGVAFVGADPNQPLTMTVTLNKGAEIVTMDCDKNLYPFEYAVVSFPQEYFPHVDATNPLARLESDGTIVVLPTYLDPENQRIYVATTAFCNILDFNGCLLPSLKQIRGKTNGPTPEFITTIEAHRNAASQEIRDFLVCLALGAWAQDFVKEVNQHSAACLLGDLTGSFAPGIGQAKAITDAVKFASEGKLVEFAFAATAAVPGGKLFTAIGKGGGAALKIEKVAKTAKIIANTGPHTTCLSDSKRGRQGCSLRRDRNW